MSSHVNCLQLVVFTTIFSPDPEGLRALPNTTHRIIQPALHMLVIIPTTQAYSHVIVQHQCIKYGEKASSSILNCDDCYRVGMTGIAVAFRWRRPCLRKLADFSLNSMYFPVVASFCERRKGSFRPTERSRIDARYSFPACTVITCQCRDW